MADEAKQCLENAKFESEVIENGSGFTVAVRQGEQLTEERVEHVTTQLIKIARETGGTYDAWETAL